MSEKPIMKYCLRCNKELNEENSEFFKGYAAPLCYLELTICKECAADLRKNTFWLFYLGEAFRIELKQTFYVAFLESLAKLKKEDESVKKLVRLALKSKDPVN